MNAWRISAPWSIGADGRIRGIISPAELTGGLSCATVDQVRIDRWLWAARFFKTRGLAAKAILSGRVQVDGERVKPSRLVRAGEVVAVTKATEQWIVAVTGVTDRRGPASVAQTLYRETADSRQARAARSRTATGAHPGRRPRRPTDQASAAPTRRAAAWTWANALTCDSALRGRPSEVSEA